jgi:N-methylhydantoinase A/oxoprolinase/acetone carboxylase beta subunit
LDEKNFNPEVIRHNFYKKYEQIYGYAHKHLEIEITLCKIILKSDQPQNIIKSTNIEYTKSKSSVYKEIYDGTKIQKYKYMHGYNLEIDKKYKGPLIIQESETTCVVPNNSILIKDANNNYIIKFT